MARRDPDNPLRWIVETGDLVYWRDSSDSRNYRPARVALITAARVYLTAGMYDPERPLGIVEGRTEVWFEHPAVAVRRLAPREAFARINGKLFYDWSCPPRFEPSDKAYRRKAS